MRSSKHPGSLHLAPLIILFGLILATGRVFAQDAGSSTRLWQTGAFIGRGLPYGMSENDNIFTTWGMRLSAPMPGTQGGFFDGTYTAGAGSAVTWQGLSAGVSLQEPLETLLLSAGIGLEAIRFTTDLLTGPHIVFGDYFLGSVMTNITSSILVRFDMTLHSQPTTVDMVDLGLVYLF